VRRAFLCFPALFIMGCGFLVSCTADHGCRGLGDSSDSCSAQSPAFSARIRIVLVTESGRSVEGTAELSSGRVDITHWLGVRGGVVRVPPGQYLVTAHRFGHRTSHFLCRAKHEVAVRVRQTKMVRVVCPDS
jgi:hypothetical protein